MLKQAIISISVGLLVSGCFLFQTSDTPDDAETSVADQAADLDNRLEGALKPPIKPENTDGKTDDLCGASNWANLVGKNISAVTIPADLNARMIYPDTIVTRDYQVDRLNFYMTKDGEITRVACG